MYREDISAYIDSKREEMLEDLSQLVRIDSVRGDALPGKPFGEGAAEALAAMTGLMDKYGLKTKNYENYAITGDFGEGEKELDILAHLDVVPVSDEWTVTQPFTPLVKDGRIYGRGTADDKGPAIAALYAVRAIKELGIPLSKSVRLIFGSDEECGSSDLDYYYKIEKEAPCTFTPDASFPLINLEKARLSKPFETSYVAVPGKKTVCAFEAGTAVNIVPAKAQLTLTGISVDELKAAAETAQAKTGAAFSWTEGEDGKIDVLAKGTAAHASLPENGNNAITALLVLVNELPLDETLEVQSLRALSKLWPHGDVTGEALGVKMEDEESGALTMNLGILKMEDGIIYGDFDVRAPLCANDTNLTAVVRDRLHAIGFKMAGGDMTPAHYVPADSEFVKKLLDSYEAFSGKPGKAMAIGGGTYVHELERGVAFGCEEEGIDNRMHGDDEFMIIDTLLMSAKIFADAIIKICG